MLSKSFEASVEFLHLYFQSQVPMGLQPHGYFDNLFTGILYVLKLRMTAANSEN